MAAARRLADLDHAHLWHPFTPMRQWRAADPLVVERGEGFELIDTDGNRYIDGVASLWCNVHGHRVPQIDRAVRDQLDKIAHTTLLGLASPPSIELAARLVDIANSHLKPQASGLTKVFYSDAGATAVEVAFKLAVGYWHHTGKPHKRKFIALAGAYHGDTPGSMSVGYSELFHKPYLPMLFDVMSFPNPDAVRPPDDFKQFTVGLGFERCAECAGQDLCGFDLWPSECGTFNDMLGQYCLAQLRNLLEAHGDETAAVVIEPLMQGAAGMICQPAGFVRGVAELARQFDVLLIADEVATGFGRTGSMFACEHDGVTPDLLCLAKGLTGGYLPLAATLCTDAIYDAFCGETDDDRRAFFHGHTYTGNPLGCAAALASLDLFETNRVLDNVQANAAIMRDQAAALHDLPGAAVVDVRQRGVMMGIELKSGPDAARQLCDAMRSKGLIIRPLGSVLVLMPAPAMPPDTLGRMMDIVVGTLRAAEPAARS